MYFCWYPPVSTYYYIWLLFNYLGKLLFVFSFHQRQRWQRKRHCTRRASRVANLVIVRTRNSHNKYRNDRYTILTVIIFLHAIFICHEIVCLAKGIIIPFAYNSSESCSYHILSHSNLIGLYLVVVLCTYLITPA